MRSRWMPWTTLGLTEKWDRAANWQFHLCILPLQLHVSYMWGREICFVLCFKWQMRKWSQAASGFPWAITKKDKLEVWSHLQFAVKCRGTKDGRRSSWVAALLLSWSASKAAKKGKGTYPCWVERCIFLPLYRSLGKWFRSFMQKLPCMAVGTVVQNQIHSRWSQRPLIATEHYIWYVLTSSLHQYFWVL